MKKIINIIVIILIIAIIIIACIFLGNLINKIKNEKLDTSYMWNVRYQNLQIQDGSRDGKTKESKDGIEIEVTLKEPKEYYEATFEIDNYGSLDAYISKINKTITSTDDILTCNITYLDGKEIKKRGANFIHLCHDAKTISRPQGHFCSGGSVCLHLIAGKSHSPVIHK